MSGDALFIVRAVLSDASLRERFDRWYASDHLPWACRVFGTDRAWRYWSAAEPLVHYAVYRFPDVTAMRERLASDGFRELVEDFDRSWPSGVARTRDLLELAQEVGPRSG